MVKHWDGIEFFKPYEFDSADEPGSGVKMNLEFVHKLDLLRKACGFPLNIVSGYRTEARNAKVGGVDGSAHTSGHAVDIHAIDSRRRFTILEEAFKMGFRRIGLGNRFIHLDDDPSKPQGVCWNYPSTERR